MPRTPYTLYVVAVVFLFLLLLCINILRNLSTVRNFVLFVLKRIFRLLYVFLSKRFPFK